MGTHIEEKTASLKKTARIAGLLYFLFASIAIYSYMYVSPKIMVRGDTAATASNMLANEFLFRTSLAGNLITHTLFVFVVLMLYKLLKQVNEHHAKIMVGLVIVAIPVALLGDSLKIIALSIFKGDLLKSFPLEQAQDLALIFLKLNNYSGQMITFYWGLWLMPLGLLVYKSRFIPRILGVLLIINGLGYIISSITFILFPDYLSSVSKFTYPTYFLGEIPLIFWLLIKGIKT